MVEHDGQVGQLLKKLDDLGIANNTIVIYTTDNGAEVMSWPDGGTTPFRGEKNTNWEGGYRVPAMVRWPGLVKPGSEINDVFSAEDWMQTLLAAVGETDLQAKLMRGATFGDKTFKVHLVPKLFDLRADPFERADKEGMGYGRWRIDRVFLLVPAQVFVNRYIQTLAEFPPRQKPASFNLEGVLDKLTRPPQGVN